MWGKIVCEVISLTFLTKKEWWAKTLKKRSWLFLLFTGLVSFSMLIGCFSNPGSSMNNLEEKAKTKKTGPLLQERIAGKLDIVGDNTDAGNGETLKSGPVTTLPWENNDQFKKAQEQAGTKVLMAAYRTVLRDPLPGEEENVHLAARMLDGIVLNPGEIFSQNQRIGPYIEDRGFKKGPTYIGSQLTTTIGGGVCKIASTLYNVAILSNLQIVERHNHGMPVPYVPYGQDATVSYGNKDLKFKNSTSSPVLIWAEGIDNILYIAFYGTDTPKKVEWHHETLSVQKAQKLYRNNSAIPAGTEKVVLEGMDGAVVKSWLTIENGDGTATTKELGLSRYRPMDHVVEKND